MTLEPWELEEWELGLNPQIEQAKRAIVVQAIKHVKNGDNEVALRYYVDQLLEKAEELRRFRVPSLADPADR